VESVREWAVVLLKIGAGIALYVLLGVLTANRVDRWGREQCEAASRMDRSSRVFCVAVWPVVAALFVTHGKSPFAVNM
jgi:hypothetical protein